MTSPVTKAMIESYALMVMVMGTFFIYFCGMVWAFCNPKRNGAEEEEEWEAYGTERQAAEVVGLHLPSPRLTTDGLRQPTYVNFWDDGDSLLLDNSAIDGEDCGIDNQIGDISKD